jgi:hypothetical protein
MTTPYSEAAPVTPGARTPGEDRLHLSIAEQENTIMTQADVRYPWNRANCTSWCTDTDHNHDPACWGGDHYVNLTMEYGYPHGALPGLAHQFDPPRIGVNAYRQQPGWHSVAYLHLYRPHDNDYLSLDSNLQVTSAEARQLAANLIAVAELLDGSI